ncbi:hypothetical protein BKA56DRAFT_594337 [Ilyonectria sp. MPI-CAGE-AT-0026]|nr:hypothetical protein BKA56DRAFT_594337 [Ilyonectria sp. MPI-CAGE-AT-0026]
MSSCSIFAAVSHCYWTRAICRQTNSIRSAGLLTTNGCLWCQPIRLVLQAKPEALIREKDGK